MIYYPQTIENVNLPLENSITPVQIQPVRAKGNVFEPKTEVNKTFPENRIAYTVISETLNTQERKILAEYSFGKSGAIQIGEYKAGESGEIKISPNGIVAKNSSGLTTFSLDGTTGNATFRGTIQADSLISGVVNVGNPSGNAGVFIDGATQRIIVHDGTHPRIVIGNI